MNRTTIMLPEILKMKAMDYAHHEKISFGELIRELLEKKLQENTLEKKCDSFYAEKLVFSGDVPSNLAENHDEYLYE